MRKWNVYLRSPSAFDEHRETSSSWHLHTVLFQVLKTPLTPKVKSEMSLTDKRKSWDWERARVSCLHQIITLHNSISKKKKKKEINDYSLFYHCCMARRKLLKLCQNCTKQYIINNWSNTMRNVKVTHSDEPAENWVPICSTEGVLHLSSHWFGFMFFNFTVHPVSPLSSASFQDAAKASYCPSLQNQSTDYQFVHTVEHWDSKNNDFERT